MFIVLLPFRNISAIKLWKFFELTVFVFELLEIFKRIGPCRPALKFLQQTSVSLPEIRCVKDTSNGKDQMQRLQHFLRRKNWKSIVICMNPYVFVNVLIKRCLKFLIRPPTRNKIWGIRKQKYWPPRKICLARRMRTSSLMAFKP